MHAIVKARSAPGLTVTTVPKPSAGPGEVLIAVRHAGVCGTDLHIADWDAWAQGRLKPPLVVGHEFAGEVVQVGDGVSEIKLGQLVTAEGHIVCGHCLQCRTGNGHICRNTRIIGVDRDGAFAEFIAMPATNVLTLDGIPTDIGAIMDPMGNAFHTVLTADIPGSMVLILGCGPIGCFAAGIARAAGAARVIASDVNPRRLALARSEEHTSELQSPVHLVCRLLLTRPPRPTLFPYTTLFRSDIGAIMDPMGNAFHTVLTADIPGSMVLILGCGPIGCFAAGIARAAGAARVIASDVNPRRLALA